MAKDLLQALNSKMRSHSPSKTGKEKHGLCDVVIDNFDDISQVADSDEGSTASVNRIGLPSKVTLTAEDRYGLNKRFGSAMTLSEAKEAEKAGRKLNASTTALYDSGKNDATDSGADPAAFKNGPAARYGSTHQISS